MSEVHPPFIAKVAWLPARLSKVSGALAAVALVVMTLHIGAEVIGRKFFGGGFPGTLDIISYWWMPTIALLGLSYSELLREHPRVTLSLPAVGTVRRRVADVFAVLVSMLVCWMLLQFSITGAQESYDIGEKAISTIDVLIWPAKFMVVVGLVLYLLQSLVSLLLAFAGQLGDPEEIDEEGGVVDVAG